MSRHAAVLWGCWVCEGRYNDGVIPEMASACTACPSGQFQDVIGQIQCKDCPASKYTATDGQSNCTACPDNFFKGGTSALGCEQCATGMYSMQGAHVCLECNQVDLSSVPSVDRCEACTGMLGIWS